jgi:hydroxypyruvate isomerase
MRIDYSDAVICGLPLESLTAMPKFCANLTFLFNEVGFVERFAAAAKAGFKGVEYMSPYEYGKDQLAEALQRNGLEQVLFNLPAGDWAKGERGIGCHPDRVGEFQDGVGRAIEYAQALGCKQVNCLAGLCPEAPEDRSRAAFVANLKFAALKMKEAGVKLLIEPINTIDIPGFYLTGSKQALGIIDEVGSDNLYLQYDIYHMQVMEGDVIATIRANAPYIAHYHTAGVPGRNEIDETQELNYRRVMQAIVETGFDGFVGQEFIPKREPLVSLREAFAICDV